jgi:hypothetical protein
MSKKDLEQLEDKLTLKQQLFCKYYIFWNEKPKLDRWNATRSYMLAYWKEEKDYDSCQAEWSKSLWKLIIKEYQRQLLEEAGFNDNFVDWVLLKLIKAWDMQAVKEYNNLMQRITKQLNVTWLSLLELNKKSNEK